MYKPTAIHTRRAAASHEYVLILAAITLALLGAITLVGRRIARVWHADLRSADQGRPVDHALAFPTKALEDMKPCEQPPVGRLPEHARADDYFKYYEPLIGEGDERLDDLTRSIPSYADLPPAIVLPDNLDEAGDAAQRRTRTSGEGRQEHGGTLVRDEGGDIHVVNPGAGGKDGFSRNLTPPAGTTTVGTFHTHPDDSPFSHQDVASTLSDDLIVKVLQNTREQWALVRTSDTPRVSPDGLTLEDAVKLALANAERGYDNPDVVGDYDPARARAATEAALARVAADFKLGLYRGDNGFPLARVGTPAPPAAAQKPSGVPEIPD